MLLAAMLLATMITDTGNAQILIPDPPAIVAENPVAENRMIAKTEDVAEPKMHLYGNCTITFYDNGACCCGQWEGGNTASGVPPTPNHTVASNSLPFGTRLLIDGQEYTVEDKGDGNMDAFWIDIYVDTHEEALRRGMYKDDVFIIDE